MTVEEQKTRYIAIEGVIGSGKTALATKLAHTLKARLILDEFNDNPFLTRFYRNPKQLAFQTQFSFLTSRYKQQQLLRNIDLSDEQLITNYTFDKDKIFAYLNLQDEELMLYETLSSLMDKTIVQPDLVVYLQSTPERLTETIQMRDRPTERSMAPEYLNDLNDAYNFFFFRYKKTPLLIVNVSELDFVHNEEDFKLIYDLVFRQQYTGTEYFKPEKKLDYSKGSV
ncbi:MAG: deoxynucleoside kinase [Chlorobiales bacterium]|nr:deoxynucleoside kinase [Chlorobiales bacterium]